ncbi:MAG: DUF1365 domain-containing protein [Kiritimatiellia bacterium]
MTSSILVGRLYHERITPVRHAFQYPVTFFALRLTELAALPLRVRGWGGNRIRAAAIHDRDYLTPGPGTIPEKLSALLQPLGIATHGCEIIFITCARVWNYVFNPASFFIGLDAAGNPAWAVAEVNNTFGDRHVYVLPALREDRDGVFVAEHAKEFHVSPFNDLRGEYHFQFAVSPQRILAVVNLHKDGAEMYRASLSGRPVPLTTGSLWRTLLRHPLRVALTFPRILAQAARLYWIRKLPVSARPVPSHPMTVKTREQGR